MAHIKIDKKIAKYRVQKPEVKEAAAPGQILCTDFVRLMARGRGGHDFVSLGSLDLPGRPDPLPFCEVRWAPAG